MAALVAGRVRGGGIRGRLIRPVHFAFLGDTLAIIVPLSLSGSLRGTGSSIRLSLEGEAAAFLCKLGRDGWCRLRGCREGASDDQGQRAQSSQNRRHGTPFIVVGAILLSRRRIAASIPVIGVPRFSNERSETGANARQAVQIAALPDGSRFTERDLGRLCRPRRRVPLHRLYGQTVRRGLSGAKTRPQVRGLSKPEEWTPTFLDSFAGRRYKFAASGGGRGRALESCVGSAT
jgi:hypothetical protein